MDEPRTFELGDSSRGKLTADQWMVICTVHLPVTLIRLWGNLTDRRFELLCNFMDLTSAVQLATQRSITAQMINDHELLIARYLNDMKRLFKGSRIQPIHHVALHTADFLRLFGPTHAVQAFGGERLLEVLGQQNVNNKSGMPRFLNIAPHHLSNNHRGARGHIYRCTLQKFKPADYAGSRRHHKRCATTHRGVHKGCQ
jgi:hypothetical protein